MKFLAVDTSQEYLSVVAFDGRSKEIIKLADCSMRHSVILMDNVERALTALGMRVSDLELIAAVVGPGSFTGIRIGVSAVKGLAAPFNIPTLAVTSFDTLAYAESGGELLAVVDARHGNFYAAGYSGGGVSLPPRFITREELDKIEGYCLVSGAPIEGLETKVVDAAQGLFNAVSSKLGEAGDSSLLAPFYLRLSQAEEGRR